MLSKMLTNRRWYTPKNPGVTVWMRHVEVMKGRDRDELWNRRSEIKSKGALTYLSMLHIE